MAKQQALADIEHVLDELLHRMVSDILSEGDRRRIDLEEVIKRKGNLSATGRRDAAAALRSVGDRFARYADMLEAEIVQAPWG
jgi:hypothetical protein